MTHDRFVYVTYIRTTAEKLWEALTKPEFTRAYWAGTWHDTTWERGASWKLMLPDGRVGWIAAAYLVLYGGIRFLVEAFRGDDRGPVLGGFTATQWIAVFSSFLAAGWWIFSFRKNKNA